MAAEQTGTGVREPLVSVIIPCYNRAHTIVDAIRSVQEQDYDNVEILVVDDGSTDGSAEVGERRAGDRVRVLRQANAGANRARNHGIDEARGVYVALLDSDDRFLPGHLRASVDILERLAGDVVVYARIIVERGGGRSFLKPPRAIREGEHMADYLLRDRGFVQTSTVVLPTALARRVRYRDDLPFGQDVDFAIRLYAAGARFVMRSEPGAIWRDVADPSRISHRSVPSIRLRWLDGLRPQIPRKAYYGGRGWYAAKAHRQHGEIAAALRCYAGAVVRGCYDPKLAATLFVQIFAPAGLYRRLVDTYVQRRRLADRA